MKKFSGFLFKKEVKQNFTKVPNELFSLDVDPYAKLVLMYLHSKSDDFIFYRMKIGETLGICRQKITSAIDELVERKIITPVSGGYMMLTRLTQDVNGVNTVDVNNRTEHVDDRTNIVPKLTPDVNGIDNTKKTENNKTIYKEGNQPLHSPTPSTGFGSARLIPEREKNHEVEPMPVKQVISINDLPTVDSKNKSNDVTPTKKGFVIPQTFNEFLLVFKGNEAKAISEFSNAMGRTVSMEEIYFGWRNENKAAPKYLGDFKNMFDDIQFNKFKKMTRSEFLQATELLFTNDYEGDGEMIFAQLRRDIELEKKEIGSKKSSTEKIIPMVFSSANQNVVLDEGLSKFDEMVITPRAENNRYDILPF